MAPWNLGGLAGLLLIGMWSVTGALGFRLRWLLSPIGVTYFAATSWMVVAALRSDAPLLASAVIAVQVMNLMLLFGLGGHTMNAEGLRRVNRTLCRVGLFFALTALVLYAPPFLRYPDLPAPEGLGFEFDRGRALRMRGLTSDPNFFGLYLALPLAIAFTDRHLPGRYLILALFSLCIAASFSRTLVLALLLGMPLAAFAGWMWGGLRVGALLRRTAVPLALVVTLGLAATLMNAEFREFTLARIASVSEQSRLPRWLQAVALVRHPILGEGLRSIYQTLGRNSHSTWLDVVVELGAVGAVIWAGYLIAVLRVLARRARAPEVMPWLIYFFVMLGMATAFSMVYNPVFLLSGAVALGIESSERRRNWRVSRKNAPNALG